MFESSVAIPRCSGEEGLKATLRLLFSFYFLASPGIELRSGSLCDKYFHPPSDLTRQKSHAFSTMRTMVDGHRGKEQQQPPISPQMQQLPLPLLLLGGLFWRSNNILEDNCTCTEHSWMFPYVQMHYSVCYNNELLYSFVNYSHRCLHCDRVVYPLALALGMDG